MSIAFTRQNMTRQASAAHDVRVGKQGSEDRRSAANPSKVIRHLSFPMMAPSYHQHTNTVCLFRCFRTAVNQYYSALVSFAVLPHCSLVLSRSRSMHCRESSDTCPKTCSESDPEVIRLAEIRSLSVETTACVLLSPVVISSKWLVRFLLVS